MLKSEKNNLNEFAENIVKLISDEDIHSKTAKDAYDLIVDVWDWKKRAENIFSRID
jgi:hypothetical protein